MCTLTLDWQSLKFVTYVALWPKCMFETPFFETKNNERTKFGNTRTQPGHVLPRGFFLRFWRVCSVAGFVNRRHCQVARNWSWNVMNYCMVCVSWSEVSQWNYCFVPFLRGIEWPLAKLYVSFCIDIKQSSSRAYTKFCFRTQASIHEAITALMFCRYRGDVITVLENVRVQ